VQFQVDTAKYIIPWIAELYDDTDWENGLAPLGTANDTTINKTILSKVTTAYFRKRFTLDSIKFQGFDLTVKGSDGAVVYINGNEIQRINIYTNSTIDYNSLAIESETFTQVIGFNSENGLLDKLRAGENLIAVEIHPSDTSRDITIDAQLFDRESKGYFTFGSSWMYSDRGSVPTYQIGDKPTSVSEGNICLQPTRFQLFQNYPNPFNPLTTIRYFLGAKAFVQINVFNILGQHVATLVKKQEAAGIHSVEFDAHGFSSGVYFYRLIIGGKVDVRKMILMK
jgi:hypothetical protein